MSVLHLPPHTGSNLEYPTSDGRPMAETDWHRALMTDLIGTLDAHFAAEPMVYVSGNLLLFYEEGNRRRHLAPDVFVVKGVPKHRRLNYLVWEEGKGPDVVIELTSKTTRREDRTKKWRLYEQTLRVPEYYLFDPREEYLKPSFQAYHWTPDGYQSVALTGPGRFTSPLLGLHLQRRGTELRLIDPATGQVLPTPQERAAQAEAEADRLRREVEALRRRLS